MSPGNKGKRGVGAVTGYRRLRRTRNESVIMVAEETFPRMSLHTMGGSVLAALSLALTPTAGANNMVGAACQLTDVLPKASHSEVEVPQLLCQQHRSHKPSCGSAPGRVEEVEMFRWCSGRVEKCYSTSLGEGRRYGTVGNINVTKARYTMKKRAHRLFATSFLLSNTSRS